MAISTDAPPRKPLYRSLYVQVMIAVIAGVLLGHFAPSVGQAMKPLGDGFIELIKMMIAPIIFCTVVTGIAGMADMKKVGKTGGLAPLYFEVVSTVALIVGLVLVNAAGPGRGMNVDPATLDTKALSAYTAPGRIGTATDFLLHIIPDTFVGAFGAMAFTIGKYGVGSQFSLGKLRRRRRRLHRAGGHALCHGPCTARGTGAHPGPR